MAEDEIEGVIDAIRGQKVPDWLRFRRGRLPAPAAGLNLVLPTFGGKQVWADRYVFGGYRIQQQLITGHCRLLGVDDLRLAWGTFDDCLQAFQALREAREVQPRSDHLVLLLHGIFRSKDAMQPMARAFRQAGYEATPVNYPSTLTSIDAHAEQLHGLIDRLEGVRTVSLVGHSMGGLVIRALLRDPAPWRERIALGRVVTIATPNRGAYLANELRRSWAFRLAAGPAADQLLPDYVQDLPEPPCEFGTVAGARGDGKGYNPLIPGDDDFTVALASTHLPGATDTMTVRGLHTFIMRMPEVVEACVRFVGTGAFR